MNCKNCGGEILLENGIGKCQSCGAIFAPEKVYENIDVFICYLECDEVGRRTKDSIVAQDVYKKLEGKKISTFYERISADGMVGDQLELCRHAALHMSKAVLVLGTSAASFKALEERYGAQFGNKPVIPFCVDVNPGEIPKTLSKVQAVNATTIGWEKDLVNGLNNILGKTNEVDTNTLFGVHRKKIILFSGIVAALLVAALTILMVIFLPKEANKSNESIATTLQTETQPPTPKEIFEQAFELEEKGNYLDALCLLEQIPDYTDSTHLIKKIYGKYEGYYKNDIATTHVDVVENTQIKLSVIVRSGDQSINTVVNTDVVYGKLSHNYVDSNKHTGNIQLMIVNAGLKLIVTPDEGEAIEVSYTLAEKSDQPFVKLNKEVILEWLNEKYTLAKLKEIFFDIQKLDMVMSDMYYIPEANIYISMSGSTIENAVVCSVSAPAEWLAPELVGKTSTPVYSENVLYIPNAYHRPVATFEPFSFVYFDTVDETVTDNTLVCVFTEQAINSAWNNESFSWHLSDAACAKVLQLAYEKFELDGDFYEEWAADYSMLIPRVAENKSHYLIAVSADEELIWYKVNKSDLSATFVRTGPKFIGTISEEQSLWYTEYIELAEEFPETFLCLSDGGFDPFSFTIKQGCKIYQDGSYSSEIIGELTSGVVALTAEISDDSGRHWCKLRDQAGWICITDILAGK